MLDEPYRKALWVCVLLTVATNTAFAQQRNLVVDGKPVSEIVISATPTRTQRLAARELQRYVQKISGARLGIVSELSDQPVKIFVGESRHTVQRGVTAQGIRNGAYRIVSGKNWLALVGDDTDFVPVEPWPRRSSDNSSGKMQTAWNKLTGKHWGYMNGQLHKHYSGSNARFGTPAEEAVDANGNIHVWSFDERGSFNAVCDFLRSLGVRWYMPGKIGEIVPKADSIALPEIDKTVRPDFPMRILNFRPKVEGREVMMWAFRLGVRRPYGRQAAHGLHRMTDNPWTLQNKPDWFALYGGERHTNDNVKCNQLCYSNQQLLREAADFARAQFDHMNMDVVSIMPPDGYTAICQCEKCAGKESPTLGPRGKLSNYVWDFVNRVAIEIGKTHPDKKISCCAYGVYTEPPSNIEKLHPNVQVIIVGGRRPRSADQKEIRRIRQAWQAKTESPIEIFENYPFTARGFYLPAFMPRDICKGIIDTKGQSHGEDIWFSMDFGPDAVAFNSFMAYFTSRSYWGGPELDVESMYDEYVRLLFGPAALETKAFYDYCELNWREMETDSDKAAKALELFGIAKDKVSQDSVYGRRLRLIDNYLNGLRNKARLLAQRRGPVPKLRLVSGVQQRGNIVVDGKLNDGPWQKIPSASTGSLRELQTGRLATFGTRFMTEWIGNDLFVAVRCDELKGDAPNSATTKDNDQAIWYGDVIEILLATDSHSYYQIAVNPSGAIISLDRGAPKDQWFRWSSQAEVATTIADDHWIAEIRIPTTEDGNDPLHQTIGRKPTQSLPWHINICRQRIRNGIAERSAFSPTGTNSFHQPMKFAHFHSGGSFKFDADESVTDFVVKSRAAEQLFRRQQYDKAMKAFSELVLTNNATDFQKSIALSQAAACAIAEKELEMATRFAEQIPNEFVAKTVRMDMMISQRNWSEIILLYGDEDLTNWPFWQIGKAAAKRGKAFLFSKDGERADADLALALRYEPDPRTKVSIRMQMAQNREQHLGDVEGALKLYLQNLVGKTRIGGADEFRSLVRASSILSEQGEHSRAIDMFDAVDLAKLKGYWQNELLIAKATALMAGGNPGEAKKLYRKVIDADTATKAQRDAATKAMTSPDP